MLRAQEAQQHNVYKQKQAAFGIEAYKQHIFLARNFPSIVIIRALLWY